MSTDRDHKIEKINAYQKLLGVTLKQVSKNDMVQAEVQIEFIEFLNDQLNILMGNESEKEDELTSDEKVFLKSFISRAQNKSELDLSKPIKRQSLDLNKNAGTTEVGKENPRKDPNPPAYVPRNLQPALGNKQTHKESKQAINKGVLDQLDEMDKKFENEW